MLTDYNNTTLRFLVEGTTAHILAPTGSSHFLDFIVPILTVEETSIQPPSDRGRVGATMTVETQRVVNVYKPRAWVWATMRL